MKKIRIAVFAAAVFLLFAFLLAGFWYQERQPVQTEDIIFQIQSGEQDFKLKLWHNYYDGKEYLFLPSFCSEDAECIVSVDAVFKCGYKEYVSRRCFAQIKRRFEKK